MHTVREAFFKIRGIASAWIGNQQAQDASEAMGQVTATLLDTDTTEDSLTKEVFSRSAAEQISATLLLCGEHAAAAVDASIANPPTKVAGLPTQLVDHSDGPVEHVWFSQAALDVGAERRRQIEAEGRDFSNDDQYTNGELAAAAGSYALHAHDAPEPRPNFAPAWWPWGIESWKPSDARRDLVKAGALILAEIERLDRLAAKATDLAPEEGLPEGLSWEDAPADAIALIGGKNDDDDPSRRLLVWVPELGRTTKGVLAVAFDCRPAGSPQNAALDSPSSMWTVLAHRPALLAEAAMLQSGIDPAPADDAQACADAFNNEYHKCRAEISRPEWDKLWVKGMTPPQLRAAGWSVWNADACRPRPNNVSAVLFRNGDETTKVEGVNWAPQSDSFRHHEVVAYRVAPVEDGWFPHHAERPCPFDRPDLVLLDIRFRDGSEKVGVLACNYTWFWRAHDEAEYDIVAYRLTQPDSAAS